MKGGEIYDARLEPVEESEPVSLCIFVLKKCS